MIKNLDLSARQLRDCRQIPPGTPPPEASYGSPHVRLHSPPNALPRLSAVNYIYLNRIEI